MIVQSPHMPLEAARREAALAEKRARRMAQMLIRPAASPNAGEREQLCAEVGALIISNAETRASLVRRETVEDIARKFVESADDLAKVMAGEITRDEGLARLDRREEEARAQLEMASVGAWVTACRDLEEALALFGIKPEGSADG